jgi:nucleolar protein 12
LELSTTHRELKKHFAKYGKIEKVWFRSIPVEANKMGRKASHLLKKYIENAHSMNAYIRF